MNILYSVSQRPGYGGAATEAYESIRWLRRLGCSVDGLFIVPQAETGLCDPDSLGGIYTCATALGAPGTDPAHYDLVIGKNHEAPRFHKRAGVPMVYITCGIDCLSTMGIAADTWRGPFPKECVDIGAFAAADYVILHSTLDYAIYENVLSPELFKKIFGEVVYTPNIAASYGDKHLNVEYSKRKYDLLFSASDWRRTMKNGPLMRELVTHYKGKSIVVCGEHADISGAETPGLVSHPRQLELLRDARVVVAPSIYDPSPNLYPEAANCGANIVISRNVGNAEYHPADLIAADMTPRGFIEAIDAALALKEQAAYPVMTPIAAAQQLKHRLSQIADHWRGRKNNG